VAKVFIVEREDARLLGVVWDIGPLEFRPGSFYRSQTRLKPEREVWRYRQDAAYFSRGAPSSSVWRIQRNGHISRIAVCGRKIIGYDVKTAFRGGHVSILSQGVEQAHPQDQPKVARGRCVALSRSEYTCTATTHGSAGHLYRKRSQ
jgi:hypothetical protein